MSLLEQVYATNVSRADVYDPNDLLAVVATWPEEWRDHFAEREAILAIDASHPYVPALPDEVNSNELDDCSCSRHGRWRASPRSSTGPTRIRAGQGRDGAFAPSGPHVRSCATGLADRASISLTHPHESQVLSLQGDEWWTDACGLAGDPFGRTSLGCGWCRVPGAPGALDLWEPCATVPSV